MPIKVNNKQLGAFNSNSLKSFDLPDIDKLSTAVVKDFRVGDTLYHQGLGAVICAKNYHHPENFEGFVTVLWKEKYPLQLLACRLSKEPWNS